MSKIGKTVSLTTTQVAKHKGGTPLVCLTAYTTPMARLVDAHCDIVLVGDSLGMVLHGLPSTLGVTLDMMVLHGQAVRRGIEHALMVVDMPFGSYEESPRQAFRNAARLMRATGCSAVKLEGGQTMAETIQFLVTRGIPVMAHVGLTPQSIHSFSGYTVQGHGADGDRVAQDAAAAAEAGAFSVVLEKVPESLARRITQQIAAPTIGIGASPECDGQVLVLEDILGIFTEFQPKFVKRYSELGKAAEKAIATYASDVRSRKFPGAEHVFGDQPSRVSKEKTA